MIWRGSYGEIRGARRAVVTSARTMRPPRAPRGFRLANLATAIQGAARAGDSVAVSRLGLATTVSRPAIIPSSRAIALLVPDPGIEHAVGQVDHQVQDQDDRGDEEDDGLEHDEIPVDDAVDQDRKSTRLNSSHGYISYAVFCLKKKKDYTHDSDT